MPSLHYDVTDEELTLAHCLAKRDGLKVAGFMRRLLHEAARRATEEDQRLMAAGVRSPDGGPLRVRAR